MDLSDWLGILIFLVIGLVIGGGFIALSMIGGRRSTPVKDLPYESGILTTRPARQRFTVDYYLVAMLFIVFDIELAFIYPLAVNLRDDGLLGLVVLVVFVFTVVEALVYIWKKGALEWR
jgi:NADH-quinone oxidoreductase subunit A